jgi:type IV pilus assembly protein PilV
MRMTRKIAGFSLLEVLLAVFILSVGLLGVAGLQLTSKRSNQEAVQRTTATMLARDLAERMRANPGQRAVYTDGGTRVMVSDVAPMAAVDCEGAECTPDNMALYDLYQWEQQLLGVAELKGGNNAGGLTSPVACIVQDAGDPMHVVVAIAWRGMQELENPGINDCGSDTGLYDKADGDNLYRRVLVVDTYLEL